MNIEKPTETKLSLEALYKALDKLKEEERRIINALYFEEKIRDLAKEDEVSSKKTSLQEIKYNKNKKNTEGEE